ncbi:secretory phospholipase A2 receptor [Biomphalaria glabrata]|nr:secretory phospholipase A2 receptor-like [Biomphalaria glabrata]
MEKLLISLLLTISSHLVKCQTINDCPQNLARDSSLKVFGNACYQFVLTQTRTHSEARQNCQSHGGTLALVKTPEIQNFLYNALVHDYKDVTDKVWIGLNDIDKENEFKWEDGTPLTYSNWGHVSSSDADDCVLMDLRNSGKWSEFLCDQSYVLIFFPHYERHPYICQYNLQPHTDTSTTTITSTIVSGISDTTVLIMSNSCPAFSCDLDCGMDGFHKNETTGCSECKCAV